MARARTLEDLIADLSVRHALLGEQIAALQAPCANRPHALLLQYVLLRSGPRAAEWGNAQGWCLPSATGTRQYRQEDVSALKDVSAEPVPAALQALAREVFAANSKQVTRRFD